MGKSTVITRGEGADGRRARQAKVAWWGFAAMLLLAVVIVTIRTKDGKETSKAIDVPGDVASVTTSFENRLNPKVDLSSQKGESPDSAKGDLSPDAPAVASLANLDPATIPLAERFEWQPKELVAVIGTHRLRDWGSASHLIFHPSGEYFIGFTNAGAQLWSVATGKRVAGNADPDFPVGIDGPSCVFTADGKSFLTRIGKYSVDLADPEHPQFRLLGKFLNRKTDFNDRSVVTPDGRWMLMTGSPTGALQVWNIAGDVPQFVKTISFASQGYTRFLQLSRDGRRLALSADSTATTPTQAILLWDIDWNTPDGPSLTPWDSPISGDVADLSPDGQHLAICEVQQPQGRLLDLTINPPRVETELVGALQYRFSPDGRQIACSGHQIQLIEQRDSGWVERARITPATGQNARFEFSPDGKALLISEYDSGDRRIWDLTTTPPVERTPSAYYTSIAFSPDGRRLATAGLTQGGVWNMSDTAPLRMDGLDEVGSNENLVPSFSPDSQLVAFHHGSHVWNLGDRSPQLILEARPSFVSFAAQGQTVQTWNDVSQLVSMPWELTKRGQFRQGSESTVIASLPKGIGHALSLRSVRPGIGRYVNLQDSGKLQVRRLNGDDQPLFEVQHPQKMVSSFAFSADGEALAALPHMAGGKGMVWDLSETAPREYPLASESGGFDSLFTPDSRHLIVATARGVEIHDWAAGRVVRQIPLPGRVTQIAPHPDGHHLATVNGNGTVYIMRIPELTEHAQRH